MHVCDTTVHENKYMLCVLAWASIIQCFKVGIVISYVIRLRYHIMETYVMQPHVARLEIPMLCVRACVV